MSCEPEHAQHCALGIDFDTGTSCAAKENAQPALGVAGLLRPHDGGAE
jgi:hypothetical protein